jgi:hypothetical protein
VAHDFFLFARVIADQQRGRFCRKAEVELPQPSEWLAAILERLLWQVGALELAVLSFGAR